MNGKHDGDPRGTHWHQYQPDGTEQCVQDALGITLPWGPLATPTAYREVFQRFATHVNVALPDDFWTELPEGWTPC